MEHKDKLQGFILDDTKYFTLLTKKFQKRKKYQPSDYTKLRAFIPGVIQKIYVEPGQNVHKGQPLLVLEAMKMKNDVLSPIDAKVQSILVKVGDVVSKDQILIEFQI